MNQMTCVAVTKNIPSVVNFVNKELEKFCCDKKIIAQVDIAIDEIFSNIIRYAYSNHVGPVMIFTEISGDPLQITLTFMDKGKKFDSLEHESPDVSTHVQSGKIGGLGIYIVKKIMDNISYEYKRGRNVLTIKKLLQ